MKVKQKYNFKNWKKNNNLCGGGVERETAICNDLISAHIAYYDLWLLFHLITPKVVVTHFVINLFELS